MFAAKRLLQDRLQTDRGSFLGLKSRLTQAWLAQPLVCMIIFIIKLQLLQSVIDGIFALTKIVAQHECDLFNTFSAKMEMTNIESLQLANTLINKTIEQSVEASKTSLLYTMKAAQGLIMFALELTIGTYACLGLSAVDMVSNGAIDVSESIIKQANTTVHSIGEEINDGLNGLSKFINGATGLLNSVTSFINGGESKIQSVNLTVSKLDNLNISNDSITDLENLRTKIPTFDETKDKVSDAIAYPFSFLEEKLNSSSYASDVHIQLEMKEIDMGTCDISNGIEVINDVQKTIHNSITAICVICGLIMLGGIAFQLWKARRNYKTIEKVAFEEIQATKIDRFEAPIAVRNMNQISYVSGNFLQKFSMEHFRYPYSFISQYVCSSALLTILGIGVAGIIISLLELGILSLVVKGSREAGEFLSEYSGNLTASSQQTYLQWQDNTNSQIKTIEDGINRDVLGWVHNSTYELNQTVSTFMNTINSEINDTLGGTILLKPMQSVVGCLIGNKAQNIEDGLTWVNKNTEITLPMLNESFSQASNNQTNAMKSNVEMVLVEGIQSIRHQINTQFIMSGIFIGIWVLLLAGCWVSTIEHISVPKFITNWKMGKTPDISDPVYTEKKPNSVVLEDQCLDRSTRMFQTPAIRPEFNSFHSSKGIIHDPDSPATPLKAMFDRDHL